MKKCAKIIKYYNYKILILRKCAKKKRFNKTKNIMELYENIRKYQLQIVTKNYLKYNEIDSKNIR